MNYESTILIFTALVAAAIGFCACALMCARVVQDLVVQVEELDEEVMKLLSRQNERSTGHPLMDCEVCGDFRGHGHVCRKEDA